MTATVIPFPGACLPKRTTEWWMDERSPAYQDCLQVKYTPERGRGVFAVIPTPKGQLVEVAPYVPIPADQIRDQDIIATYVYEVDDRTWAFGMGYAGLYNHSDDPNVTWEVDTKSKRLLFRALRDIEPDEELVLDYRGDSGERLWFEPR